MAMKIKIKLTTIYYVVAIAILTAQAVQTVYQLSQTVGFGQKISNLQQQKANLTNQQMMLSKQISQTMSISNLGTEISKDFIPIRTPILVSKKNSLASRIDK